MAFELAERRFADPIVPLLGFLTNAVGWTFDWYLIIPTYSWTQINLCAQHTMKGIIKAGRVVVTKYISMLWETCDQSFER